MKFYVTGNLTIPFGITVEASSEEEAKRLVSTEYSGRDIREHGQLEMFLAEIQVDNVTDDNR
jgi:hypothetical protein